MKYRFNGGDEEKQQVTTINKSQHEKGRWLVGKDDRKRKGRRRHLMKKGFLIFFLLIVSPGLVYGQNAEIHKAAYNGDIQRVQELLRKGVNPDARESEWRNGPSRRHVSKEYGDREAPTGAQLRRQCRRTPRMGTLRCTTPCGPTISRPSDFFWIEMQKQRSKGRTVSRLSPRLKKRERVKS